MIRPSIGFYILSLVVFGSGFYQGVVLKTPGSALPAALCMGAGIALMAYGGYWRGREKHHLKP